MATDRAWSCPTQAIATALSARTRTFGYEFADRTAPLAYGTPAPGLPSSGAGHASDLSYLSGRHRCDVWDDEVSAELRLPR